MKTTTTTFSLVKCTTKLSCSYYLDQCGTCLVRYETLDMVSSLERGKNLQQRKPLEPIIKRHYIPKKYDDS